MIDERQIREIVVSMLEKEQKSVLPAAGGQIPVEVSARHAHLCKSDVERLFGAGYTLTPIKELSQPGEFLCKERVSLVTGKSELRNVAILGPVREKTQVELSATDARQLGIKVPVRLSGDLSGAADVLILAGGNYIDAKSCAIVAQNHIHAAPKDAERLGLRDGECVRVSVGGERPVTFERVIVRVSEKFALSMHIDFDEANACMLICGAAGTILPDCCAPPVEASAALTTGKTPARAATEKLITEKAAVELCASGENPLVFPKGTVITPLARDVFSSRRVRYEVESGKGRIKA